MLKICPVEMKGNTFRSDCTTPSSRLNALKQYRNQQTLRKEAAMASSSSNGKSIIATMGQATRDHTGNTRSLNRTKLELEY